jgi:hypothetical protein
MSTLGSQGSQSGIQRRGQLFKKPGDTEYIFYCKRAILFLSSSKILTSSPGESDLPTQQRRGVHTRRAERGRGVNILEDERNRIALLQ